MLAPPKLTKVHVLLPVAAPDVSCVSSQQSPFGLGSAAVTRCDALYV